MRGHAAAAMAESEIHEFYNRQSQESTTSLAQTLRQRREFTEKLEQERKMLGLNKNRQKHVFRNLPTQTDGTGSGIRIRPQETPRINLLKLTKKAMKDPSMHIVDASDDVSNHPILSQNA